MILCTGFTSTFIALPAGTFQSASLAAFVAGSCVTRDLQESLLYLDSC
ncbi:MAG: hypothetical protein KFF73_02020 [Cyclobacteriaceae bacterium]|nr:hypothetical protein [Cyclobacteriaceae bacterium]